MEQECEGQQPVKAIIKGVWTGELTEMQLHWSNIEDILKFRTEYANDILHKYGESTLRKI